MKTILPAVLLSLSLVIAGCGSDGGSTTPVGDRLGDTGGDGGGDTGGTDNTCTAGDEKDVVHTFMNDVYYWYDEVPDVDPADYSTKEDLLVALTQPERNRGHVYSYLTTIAAEDAFLSNAAYVGFGFSMAQDQNGDIYLRESFPGGPAAAAGMVRGDRIDAIDGVAVSTMTDAEFNAALGPNEEGYEVTFEVYHPDLGTRSVTVAKAEVEAPVVGNVVHDLGAAQDTTYIFFRSFVEPAFEELDTAFAAMQAAGDTKLVLDLRYNGGGLVSVAQHLGSLIGGVDNDGEVIAKIEFNDRYASNNEEYLLETLANSVDISDLVVITTGNTASASEMIINGLEPFSDNLHVAIVGSTTYGKPVGQSRLEFSFVNPDCDEDILRAVTFSVVNSVGTSDYYTGFTPAMVGGCPANDDLMNALGDTDEASLASALYYLDNAYQCDSASAMKARRVQAKMMSLQPDGNPFIRDGWDLLIGGAK